LGDEKEIIEEELVYGALRVDASTVTANQAVIEAEIFRYVTDREVYNQLDNDVRINSVLQRSDGRAEASVRAQWNSANAQYPPTVYGSNSTMSKS